MASALACLLWALVRSFGLERGHPLVALMAFTPYAALGALVATVLALAVRTWPAAIVAAAALTLLVLAMAPRALGGPEEDGMAAGSSVTVLALNLYEGRADPAAVLSLVDRHDADIVCLSELTPAAVRRLDDEGLGERLPERELAAAPGADGTGIYAKGALQPLPGVVPGIGETPMARARVDLGGGGDWGEVVSVHVRAPTDDAAGERWEAGLEALPAPSEPGAQLLAGDFNATLDHAELRDVLERGYEDAADAAGAGLAPTWPVIAHSSPPLTIDHLLAEEGSTIRSYALAEVPGTDHRGVVAELRLP